MTTVTREPPEGEERRDVGAARRRGLERLGLFARAFARRAAVGLHRALLADPETLKAAGDRDEAEVAGARELARSAGRLKGGVAKLAQLMAYQEGPGAAVGAEARRVLSTLWSGAGAADREAIRRVVAQDLGASPEEVFAEWSDEPMAAASLGQVHAARARDGTKLAVKVQYPGVAEALRGDLESRRMLRKLAGTELGGSLPAEAVEALREAVLGELDYLAEGRSLARFGAAFAGDPAVRVPGHFASLSSARVLAMERLEGRPLAEVAARGGPDERTAVARALFRFAWESPLRHGLINADPNPGNYLVLDTAFATAPAASPDAPDPSGAAVGFLDFGCVAELPDALVEADRALFRAILRRDGEAMRHAVHRAGLLGDPQALDTNAFREWEAAFAGPFLARGERELRPDDVRRLSALTSRLVHARGMALPPSALLLWRQRLGAQAVIASLRPRMDFRLALAEELEGPREARRLLRTVYNTT